MVKKTMMKFVAHSLITPPVIYWCAKKYQPRKRIINTSFNIILTGNPMKTWKNILSLFSWGRASLPSVDVRYLKKNKKKKIIGQSNSIYATDMAKVSLV